jgi:hypothetical protein
MNRLGLFLGGLALVACTSFGEAPATNEPADASADSSTDGSADAGGCTVDRCLASEPSCRSFDFEAGCGDVTFEGDSTGTTRECAAGKLHIAARGTLDVTGKLETTTPGIYDAANVSVRIAVKDWDGGRVLAVALGGTRVIELRAVLAASGNPRFSLCSPDASCAEATFETKGGEEHVFAIAISKSAVSLAVDCRAVATVPTSAALGAKVALTLTFGKTDAEPIDGTFDDVVFSFR